MFDSRDRKRMFYSAPQSVRSFVAAFLEPTISVLTLLLLTAVMAPPVTRWEFVLCLLVFALTFPGRNRFSEPPWVAAMGIFVSWAALLVVLTLCGYATQTLQFFDRRVLMVWAVATPVLQCAFVLIGRSILLQRAKQRLLRRPAVVVGAGPLGAKVANALASQADEGVDFLGYFDDRFDERIDETTATKRLGGLRDVADHVWAHSVREVYITLPLSSQPRIQTLLESLQGTTASLFFVPDVFGISIIQGRLQDMNGVPVAGILETPFTGTNELVKRISDVVLSSIILLMISPILVALAIGVKLSSPGPVIFKQRRNGLDGEEITVYKFRSMRAMDNGAVVKQASKGDPRITKFGAFIRRTSLDELPQFLNVLQGRMSIVGPRPHAVAHNEEYRKLIRAYMVRHKVKPGITGWAQVNGLRGETETVDKMKARVEYDLEYLRNWSLMLDLQIIARTFWLMFFDRHAY